MRGKTRTPRIHRRGAPAPAPTTPQAQAASLTERLGQRGLTTGGISTPPQRKITGAGRMPPAALVQHQVVEAINHGFAQVNETLRLGLEVEDPQPYIDALGAELQQAQQANAQLQAENEELRALLAEATGQAQPMGEAEEPEESEEPSTAVESTEPTPADESGPE